MEGINLLEAKNGGVGDLMLLLVILQVVKNFAGAEDDPTGAFGDGGIGKNFLEGAAGQIGNGAGGTRVPQESFGGENDEGLDDLSKGLAADEVKVVGRGGGVGDGHIVLGAKLEESLEAGAGVFGPLPVVAVGEKKGKAGGGAPFGFGGGDVLIDLGLRAVGEITELGFPDDEHIGAVQGVSVIEPENRGFGEGGVIDAEGGLVFGEIFQRNVASAGTEVVDGGVAVAEGAAAAVLAGEPNGGARGEKRGESEMFGAAPIEQGFARGHGATGVEDFADLTVDLVIGRNGGDGDAKFSNFLGGDRGRNFVEQGGAGEGRLEPGLNFADDLAGFLQRFFRDGVDLGADLFDFFLRDQTCIQQSPSEKPADGRVSIDFGVQGGLGEVRLVAFVVPVSAVANDIENDVLVKLLPKLEGELNDVGCGQRIVAIDVKNG